MSITAEKPSKPTKPAFSSPFAALFYKEYCTQYPVAFAIVFVGALIQLAFIMASIFPEVRFEPDLFAVAFFVTALYAGVSATLSFANEREEKTFEFLRKLPLAPKTVLSAKVAWLVVSTPLVLAANCLITGLLQFFVPWSTLSSQIVWGVFGLSILEAAVWGLFWSPRCQKDFTAILLTCFTASLFAYTAACFSAEGPDVLLAYLRAVPIRLAVVLIVSIFACRNMLRWFDMNISKSGNLRSQGRNLLQVLPYPKRLQSPFFALLHHAFRQSQILLLVGLALSLLFCTVFMVDLKSFLEKISLVDHMDRVILLIFSGVFYIWYCGNIFGQDQTNYSFRILSRFGTSPRKVWWSRILLFGSIAALPCVFFLIAVHLEPDFFAKDSRGHIKELFDPMVVAFFLIPFSVGSFISITVRNTMVAVALTGAGSILLFFWMLLGIFLCWFNPLWTTLPICIALLVASRLRCVDWLRERLTWKSRLVPLIPLFVTIAAVFVAIPPVRIYTVPLYSLDQMRAELDRTKLPEMLSPEKRTALFEKVAAEMDKPFTEDDWIRFSENYGEIFRHWDFTYKIRQKYPEIWKNGTEKERADLVLQSLRQNMNETPNFEEWAMQQFSDHYRLVKTGNLFDNSYYFLSVLKRYNRLPWEKERALRVLHYVSILRLQSASLQKRRYENWDLQDMRQVKGAFDLMPWDWTRAAGYYFYEVRNLRLFYVEAALHCYYLDHDNTLPESLDELVGKYIDAVPIDPKTGIPMEYQPEKDEKLIAEYKNDSSARNWSHKPGWSYIVLPQKIKLEGQLNESDFSVYKDLSFLPGYDEYGKKD